MDLFTAYYSKIKFHLESLMQLEMEYKNRNKSKIYLEKRIYHKNSINDWKRKLEKLGTESNILVVTFSKPKNIGQGVSIFKRYKTQYVGINEEIACQLIKLNHPEARDFTFKIISPGVLNET